MEYTQELTCTNRGIQYLRARYYKMATGTFTSRDTYAGTLTDILSQNRYTYAENNPVTLCDPSGHFSLKGVWNAAKAKVSSAVSAVKRAVTSVVNTVTGKRNTATKSGNISPAITRNRNSLLTATELRNVLKNQAVQARAAKSRAKAEIVEAPLEWINSAGAWLDKGITKAVGYNDASFRGQYDYMVAEWITEAECAAYDYCINTLQKLLPKADVERVLKGTGLIIGGAFKEIGGIMLTAASTTVSWAGIGIPGMAAGVITASAGASDIKQGIEEFSLGWNGDSITKTTKGLCDMLYGGNESIYHLSTGISGMAGNLLTSYVIAAYSKNPITAAEALKTTEKKPTTKAEGTPAAEGEIAGSTVEGGLEPGTLSNVDARKWYLEQEAKIPDLIDDSLPLEQQARQAFDLRNQYRTQARELMSDRQLAESLYSTDPNLTWEQIVQKQIDKGLSGDDIYKAIIESSQRSRTSVNQSLGLE